MDTRTPPKILEWMLIGATFPVWGPLIAGLWLHSQYRKRFPPPSDKWHHWYAWRPVRAQSQRGDTAVWLETIERRRFYSSIDYRLPDTADPRC